MDHELVSNETNVTVGICKSSHAFHKLDLIRKQKMQQLRRVVMENYKKNKNKIILSPDYN